MPLLDIMNPDFLILTAMPIERDKTLELIDNLGSFGYYFYGTITQNNSGRKYKVVQFTTGQGPVNASAKTTEALNHINPKRIILTGIAAGFSERNIELGDILIPNYILDYNYGKTTEGEGGNVINNHRGVPLKLSQDMHYQAVLLTQVQDKSWTKYISSTRPDGIEAPPRLICDNFTTLGSGSKVVDTVLDADRQWLIDKEACGLEMESYGVLTACVEAEKPCLVIKGVQDNGNNKSDKWREYSAEAAAAYTVYFIKNYEELNDSFYKVYQTDLAEVKNNIFFNASAMKFPYNVKFASRYTKLTRNLFDYQGGYDEILNPSPHARRVIIHGEGGKGKTQILKNLFVSFANQGYCPIFINLKKYSQNIKPNVEASENEIISMILDQSVPRRNAEEIRRLSIEAKVILLIDGLNEIPDTDIPLLFKFLESLYTECPDLYIYITHRMRDNAEASEYDHAIVDPLSFDCAKSAYDEEFGQGSFEKLNDNLKKIFTRPFFLCLALNSRHDFSNTHIWSQIFLEFFSNHSKLTDDELLHIADITMMTINDNCVIDTKLFRHTLQLDIMKKLTDVNVCSIEDGAYEHDLWRDFFAAKDLSTNKEKWIPFFFDKATNYASNLESLMLTLELINEIDVRDDFLKAVFDWSYNAALDCILQLKNNLSYKVGLNEGICNAILAAITEKKFDTIERTRKNAECNLARNDQVSYRELIMCDSRQRLSEYIAHTEDSEEWYILWKELFTKRDGSQISDEDLEKIDSSDSIIGWTISNLLRRVALTSDQMAKLRKLFIDYKNNQDKNTVRWRIVHVLGAYAEKENVELLLDALHSDLYYWVSYGAARALTEIAAKADNDLRNNLINMFDEYLSNKHMIPVHMQRKINQEILESAFIKNPRAGWKEYFKPVLDIIVKTENYDLHKDLLGQRVSEFLSYDDE